MPKSPEPIRRNDGTSPNGQRILPRPLLKADAPEMVATAKRIEEREKRSTHEKLNHYRDHGRDLIYAKKRLAHGEWMNWASKLPLSLKQIERYMKFAEIDVTSNLPDEDRWGVWRGISGNGRKREKKPRNTKADDDDGSMSVTISAEVRQMIDFLRNAEYPDPEDVVAEAVGRWYEEVNHVE